MKTLTILFLLLAITACSATHERPEGANKEPTLEGGLSKEEPPQDTECIPPEMMLVDFQEVNQAVFSSACTQCHSGASGTAGIDTSNFDAVKADLQRIFDSIQSGRMPFVGSPISDDKINLIAAWMNVGAPERLEDLTICE